MSSLSPRETWIIHTLYTAKKYKHSIWIYMHKILNNPLSVSHFFVIHTSSFYFSLVISKIISQQSYHPLGKNLLGSKPTSKQLMKLIIKKPISPEFDQNRDNVCEETKKGQTRVLITTRVAITSLVCFQWGRKQWSESNLQLWKFVLEQE